MTMTLVSTTTLDSSAASITFSSIPQTGTDLLLVVSPRSATGGNAMTLQFNGSSSGYTDRRLSGLGTSRNSTSNYLTDQLICGYASSSAETSNTFGNNSVYISNYTSSLAKSISSDGAYEHNNSGNYMSIISGSWSGTSAVTSITLYIYSGTFATSTVASLYIITKGSGGATVS